MSLLTAPELIAKYPPDYIHPEELLTSTDPTHALTYMGDTIRKKPTKRITRKLTPYYKLPKYAPKPHAPKLHAPKLHAPTPHAPKHSIRIKPRNRTRRNRDDSREIAAALLGNGQLSITNLTPTFVLKYVLAKRDAYKLEDIYEATLGEIDPDAYNPAAYNSEYTYAAYNQLGFFKHNLDEYNATQDTSIIPDILTERELVHHILNYESPPYDDQIKTECKTIINLAVNHTCITELITEVINTQIANAQWAPFGEHIVEAVRAQLSQTQAQNDEQFKLTKQTLLDNMKDHMQSLSQNQTQSQEPSTVTQFRNHTLDEVDELQMQSRTLISQIEPALDDVYIESLYDWQTPTDVYKSIASIVPSQREQLGALAQLHTQIQLKSKEIATLNATAVNELQLNFNEPTIPAIVYGIIAQTKTAYITENTLEVNENGSQSPTNDIVFEMPQSIFYAATYTIKSMITVALQSVRLLSTPLPRRETEAIHISTYYHGGTAVDLLFTESIRVRHKKPEIVRRVRDAIYIKFITTCAFIWFSVAALSTCTWASEGKFNRLQLVYTVPTITYDVARFAITPHVGQPLYLGLDDSATERNQRLISLKEYIIHFMDMTRSRYVSKKITNAYRDISKEIHNTCYEMTFQSGNSARNKCYDKGSDLFSRGMCTVTRFSIYMGRFNAIPELDWLLGRNALHKDAATYMKLLYPRTMYHIGRLTRNEIPTGEFDYFVEYVINVDLMSCPIFMWLYKRITGKSYITSRSPSMSPNLEIGDINLRINRPTCTNYHNLAESMQCIYIEDLLKVLSWNGGITREIIIIDNSCNGPMIKRKISKQVAMSMLSGQNGGN